MDIKHLVQYLKYNKHSNCVVIFVTITVTIKIIIIFFTVKRLEFYFTNTHMGLQELLTISKFTESD